jgi:FAD/FMN-containing dehydrogenase
MNSTRDFTNALTGTVPEDRLTYQKGIATVHPESADEAAAVFKLANETGQRIYITGFGNNIDPFGERFEELIVIRTDRLGDIRSVDPANLTIEVGAGYPLREMNLKLQESGVFFPLANLAYPGSVGGALAVGLSANLDPEFWDKTLLADGSPAPATIEIKRYLLEVEMALPNGKVKRIGAPAAPGTTGESYCGIFSPSWGLFGLIISAKLRLMPESGKVEYNNLRQREIDCTEFLSHVTSADDYLSQVRKKFDTNCVLTELPIQE